ncbi:hypothetical protein GGR04_001785 [Aureimonas pseudogalii]|uniref:Uncharacterized protein n=1 Tax=Aureimonas pseudogalii TaxID=1744844 RepID=A0A7W6EEL2_9HYPH|nr:hypothetical protein [Aureimonas pseudogalii]
MTGFVTLKDVSTHDKGIEQALALMLRDLNELPKR